MIQIDYTRTFQALDLHVARYNAGALYSKRLKAGMVHTAQEIIKLYSHLLIKKQGVGAIEEEPFGAFRTNSPQLATLAHSCARTVRRHIVRLLEAGVLVEKLFRGSKADYRLWINPELLCTNESIDGHAIRKQLETLFAKHAADDAQGHDEKDKRTNWPHTDAFERINNRIIGVHNTESTARKTAAPPESAGNETRRPDFHRNKSENVAGNDCASNTGGKVQKKSEDAGGKVSSAPSKAGVPERGEEAAGGARDTTLRFYASMLWSLARNTLYRNTDLTDHQEQIGEALLYQWYAPVSTQKLSHVHQVYVERMSLVRKYIARDPQRRYVQLPYRYFDPANKSGFTATRKWLEDHRRHQEEVRHKLVLSAQIRRYLNNRKKPQHKQQPVYELFRSCERRLRQLDNPLLLEQFHAAVLSPEAHRNLHSNTKTPKSC